jgi:hypothetical protein
MRIFERVAFALDAHSSVRIAYALPFAWRGKESAVSNQGIWLSCQMWNVGGTWAGSSRVAVLTPRLAVASSSRNSRYVPQSPQNSRVARVEAR